MSDPAADPIRGEPRSLSPFPPPFSATGTRIPALDGLRGLAILMVLVMHCYVIVPTPPGIAVLDLLKLACSLFFTGVDLFFVLSGFLIGGILLDNQRAPRLLSAFFARRGFRILPLYALLLLSFVCCRDIASLVALNRGAYFESPVPVWSYFAMVQNIAMGWVGNVGNYWLSPTWSLGIEEQFYLLMPLLAQRFGTRGFVYAAVLAFVLCPLLRVAALLFSGNTVAATFLLPMRADALFAGVLGAVIVRHEPAVQLLRRHRSLLGAALLVLAAFLAVLTTRSLSAGAPLMISVGYTVAAVFFAGSVLWVVLFPASLAARLCRFEPLCAIGVVSYFVYLAHTPVFFVTHWLARGQPPLHLDWTGAALTVLALGLTAALAALSWRWLETPLLRLGRRFTYS